MADPVEFEMTEERKALLHRLNAAGWGCYPDEFLRAVGKLMDPYRHPDHGEWSPDKPNVKREGFPC